MYPKIHFETEIAIQRHIFSNKRVCTTAPSSEKFASYPHSNIHPRILQQQQITDYVHMLPNEIMTAITGKPVYG